MSVVEDNSEGDKEEFAQHEVPASYAAVNEAGIVGPSIVATQPPYGGPAQRTTIELEVCIR